MRPDLTILELDGEAVIYDERSGELHHLNASATLVLSLCDGTATVEEIAAAVADAFPVSRRDAIEQVSALIERLDAAGLFRDAEPASSE